MGSSTWYMSSTVWAADIAKASSLLCVVSSRLNCLVALANLGGVALLLGLIRLPSQSSAQRSDHATAHTVSFKSDNFSRRTSQGHASASLPQLRGHKISFPLNPELVSQLARTGQCTRRAETPVRTCVKLALWKFQTPFAEPRFESMPSKARMSIIAVPARREISRES
jgi:hypothetical protein